MLAEKIKDHFENKKYAKIIRSVGKNTFETSVGYIVDHSKDFLLLQETDDFKVLGYLILPIDQIEKIRFNKWDKYYNNIMIWEGEIENVTVKYKIDLTTWQSIFKSITSHKLNVIVECESPDIDSFTIGPLIKTTKKRVHIQDFDPCGFLNEIPTSIDFDCITIVKFDDRYINIFSKYLRNRKSPKKIYSYSISKGKGLSATRIK
jgi:hypothetical protein